MFTLEIIKPRRKELVMHESFERLLEISNGLSQEVIARRIDESPQTLTNWKKRGVSKAGALKAAAEFGFLQIGS